MKRISIEETLRTSNDVLPRYLENRLTVRDALLLLLDHVDYTTDAYDPNPNSLLFVVLPEDVIRRCRETLEKNKP